MFIFSESQYDDRQTGSNHRRDGILEKHEGHSCLRRTRCWRGARDPSLRAKKRDWLGSAREGRADDRGRAGGHMNGASADETAGMEWWNAMSEDQRAYWFREANTAIVAEAWAYYCLLYTSPSPRDGL